MIWIFCVVGNDLWRYGTNPLNPDTDFDGQIDSVDLIPKDYDMNGDCRINHVDLVDPDSAYYVERIAWAANHDPWLDRDASGGLIGSYDMSGDGVLNENADDMSRDGMPTSYEERYGVANGGWQHPYLYNARYAVLLASGSWDSGENYPAYWNDIKYLYDVLVDDYNYLEENVHLLYSVWGDEDQDHSDGCETVDDEATNPALFSAIDHIGEYITVNDFMILAMRGHGSKDWDGAIELIDESMMPDNTVPLSFNDLNNKIGNKIKHYNRMTILLGSCYSGNAIPELEGENRIVMTSSKVNEKSWCTVGSSDETGAFFYCGKIVLLPGVEYCHDGVIKSLGSLDETPYSLGHAFDKGYVAAQNNIVFIYPDTASTPQISNKILAQNTYI